MAAHSEEHGNVGSKTLFIRNLPYSSTNESLEKVFSDIGPIKECFVVGDKGTGRCRGFGYVKFSLFEDAESALKTVEKVDGRPVHLMFANRKEKKKRQPRHPPNSQTGIDDGEDDVKPNIPEIKDEPEGSTGKRTAFTNRPKREKVKRDPKSRVEGKRARLIVRNLSFWCSEDQLRETFSKYGKIVDVHIPKKDDGKKFGFGFVQFSNKAEAGMAVKYHTGKLINDRPVAVDFTLPKVMYEQRIAAKAPAAPETENGDSDEAMDVDEIEMTVKEESDTEVKEEDLSEEDNEEQEEDSDDEEEEEDDASEKSDDSEEDNKENDESSESDDDFPTKSRPKIERQPDVNQGKTLFIRNLPFDTEEEDIENYFSQFGSILYTRCVMDHATGMSKGSAFVKFSTKESANNCLKGSEEGSQHSIGGRDLFVSLALDKNSAQDLKKDKTKLPKDSRNLYLAREGMIRPGTLAAKDVPASDLAKRLKNDETKRKKLKDQNTFISSTRLCVHNIPSTVTAQALRALITKQTGCKRSELVEVKIMWDLKRVNSQGKPKSKGFGFIGFSTHEMALAALHKLNNNADTFGPSKRPIVEFAIENRSALKLKEKRLEKCKMRANQEKEKEAMKGGLKKKGVKRKATSASLERANQDKIARSLHTGPIGLPRHSGAKQRHKARPGQMQDKAKKPKRLGHPANVKQERRQREPKVKPKENSRRNKGRMDTDSFDKIVAAHKKKMMSSSLSI